MTVPIATLEAELAGLKAEKAHYQAQCETAESELNIWRSSILQTNKIATTRKEELRVENADRMFMIRELKREYSDLSFRLQQRGQSTVFELPPAPLRGTSHDIQVKNEAPVAGPSTSRTQPSRPFLLPSIVPSTDIIDLTDDSGELERVTLQPAVPSRNTKRKGLNSQPPEFLSTQEGPKPGKEEVKVKPKVASPLVETKKPVSQHTHVLPDTKPPQQVKRSFGSLSAYYQDTEKFKIQPTPDPHFTISRIELSSLYGGNPMTLVHCIKAARNPVDSCDRELVFPQPGLNTSIPSQPGYPGAMFSSTLEASRLDIKSLFSKYRGAQWTYLGEYTFTVCGKVPADIFAGLNQKSKNKWGKRILDARQGGYLRLRARVALRLQKTTFEDGDVEKEMEIIKSGQGILVKKDDIIQAISKGEESIDLYRLECVAYDHAFVQHMKDHKSIPGPPEDTEQVNIADRSGASKRARKKAYVEDSDVEDIRAPSQKRRRRVSNDEYEVESED